MKAWLRARRTWHLVIGVAIVLGTLTAVDPHSAAAPRANAAGLHYPGNPGGPQFPGNPGIPTNPG